MSHTQTNHDNTPVKTDFAAPAMELPSSARVVVVGGGVAGTSIAYHFAKAGWTDVCLLEQNKISSGTTWHAAGMVGQLRSSSAQTRVNKASVELYQRLAEETGHDLGWVQCGGLQLAASEARMHQLQRNAAMAEVFDVEAEVISAKQCADYYPMLRTEDLVGGVYLPGDGRVLPGECAVAMAKGALQGGVRIVEGCAIEALHYDESRNGIKRFTGLKTNLGEIKCEWIVLACNMWMRQIGLSVGVDIPVYPCEHHYVVTRPIEGVTRNSPCSRDPDAGTYFRSLDDGGMKLGAFKKHTKYWKIGDRVPNDFAFSLLEPDWPDFEEPFAALAHRLQGITKDDVTKFVNGPEAFTPDNRFIMGQPFLTEGLFVQGGWNSAGIACSGGAGKYAVEWIENGGMTMDLSSVDVRRFQPFQNEREFLQQRVSEVLGLHYQMAWPGREMETSRGQRASSMYEVHKQANAFFGQVAGWERPRYYAPDGQTAEIEYSFIQQNWHDWVAEEVRHCRESVAIMDQSTFGKFSVTGPDALSTLQHLCGADIDCEVGRAVYTGLFNPQGTFEADLVVARLQSDEFYLVTSTAQQRKDFDWITRNTPPHADVQLVDVTETLAVLGVMGPRSLETLNRISPADFSTSPPPYGTVRQVNVDGIEITAIRVSYVGEHGWELHVKSADAVPLYEKLKDAGADFGIRLIGTQAISAMRIEKGFRAYGHELSPAENPFQAGLSFAIDWSTDFIGKSALEAIQDETPTVRLACLRIVGSDVTLWGGEPILWDGKVAGYTSSACYGPTLGTSVAMGYVKNPSGQPVTATHLREADFTIKQIGKSYKAEASLRPWC